MRVLNPIRETSKARKANSGFSLIELLIVVAIILVIAAIAVPNLIKARIAANQAAAIENCRTITSAQIIYYTAYAGFAPSLNGLGGTTTAAPTPTNAQLIDDALSSGVRSGYIYTYVPLSIDSAGNYQDYSLNADPQTPTLSGVNHYFTDEPSVIHVNTTVPAAITDPPIQ